MSKRTGANPHSHQHIHTHAALWMCACHGASPQNWIPKSGLQKIHYAAARAARQQRRRQPAELITVEGDTGGQREDIV